MPIWTLPTVAQEPTAHMHRWRVYRFTLNDQHWDVLSGWDPEQDCGRASTPIVTFDPGGLRAQTRSGRVYNLVGAPGFDQDALYVFRARFGTTVPDGWQLDEVTNEYWCQMTAEVWPRFQETAPELAAELSDLALTENQLIKWLCAPTRETGTTPVEMVQSGREQDVRRLILWLSQGFLG